MNLFDVIEELVSERGLNRDVLAEVIAEGMLAAYQRKYPEVPLKAEYSKADGAVHVFVEKKVVASVEEPLSQVAVKKARFYAADANVDDLIWVPFEEPIGRIEILRARQVIASKIRKIEAAAVYEEFKDRLGEVVHGTVHKSERAGVVVKLGDQMALLPKNNMSPVEKYVVGYPIKALLKEVLVEPRSDYQLVLDRASEAFLGKLFELEIPEIFEKLVEIKRIVRSPGYKTKVVVSSNDSNIDPVGTCVGVGGSRIKPILKELCSEKIDVIPWVDSKEALIRQSLKPAQVDRVELSDNEKSARVWLGEDQRALAIGKMGQNIALASRLTGVEIQLVQNEPSNSSRAEERLSGENGENVSE